MTIAATNRSTAAVPLPRGEGSPRSGGGRACRVCGCTDDRACLPHGCCWVGDENLCDACYDLIVQLDPVLVTIINCMSYEDMLRRHRHAPTGSPEFQGPRGEYFGKVMARKRAEVGPHAHAAASKAIGWGERPGVPNYPPMPRVPFALPECPDCRRLLRYAVNVIADLRALSLTPAGSPSMGGELMDIILTYDTTPLDVQGLAALPPDDTDAPFVPLTDILPPAPRPGGTVLPQAGVSTPDAAGCLSCAVLERINLRLLDALRRCVTDNLLNASGRAAITSLLADLDTEPDVVVPEGRFSQAGVSTPDQDGEG